MSTDSVVEQLRTMDGELFKSELVLRFYLSMKTHAVHSLGAAFASSSEMYASVLSSYAQWSRAVSDEEMAAIRSLEGVDDLWLQVVTTYVRQSYRSSEKAVSVRIKTPDLDEFVRSFYKWLVRAQGCANGSLWTGDAIRIDFVTREAFRCALMDSIHILRVEKDFQDDIGPDDSVSRFCDDDDATTVVTVREKNEKKNVGSGPSVAPSAVSRSSKASRFTAARLKTIEPIHEEEEAPSRAPSPPKRAPSPPKRAPSPPKRAPSPLKPSKRAPSPELNRNYETIEVTLTN